MRGATERVEGAAGKKKVNYIRREQIIISNTITGVSNKLPESINGIYIFWLLLKILAIVLGEKMAFLVSGM